jgi:hypothetical protein
VCSYFLAPRRAAAGPRPGKFDHRPPKFDQQMKFRHPAIPAGVLIFLNAAWNPSRQLCNICIAEVHPTVLQLGPRTYSRLKSNGYRSVRFESSYLVSNEFKNSIKQPKTYDHHKGIPTTISEHVIESIRIMESCRVLQIRGGSKKMTRSRTPCPPANYTSRKALGYVARTVSKILSSPYLQYPSVITKIQHLNPSLTPFTGAARPSNGASQAAAEQKSPPQAGTPRLEGRRAAGRRCRCQTTSSPHVLLTCTNTHNNPCNPIHYYAPAFFPDHSKIRDTKARALALSRHCLAPMASIAQIN